MYPSETMNARAHAKNGRQRVPQDETHTARQARISVIIPTRDRHESVVKAVRSILDNDHEDFEVIVVDQSADERTKDALQTFEESPSYRYLRMPPEGVSAARNRGIEAASGELIALTDDDCLTPSDWLRNFAEAFAQEPGAAIVFGNVVSGEFDRTAGFVPSYIRAEPYLATGIHDKLEVEGMSACMGIRRKAWERLGGFDERFGVGAPLKSGAETDFTIRALLDGLQVYETPSVSVVHDGFRTWQTGEALIDRYWYGTGAVYAKHFRHDPRSALSLLTQLARRRILSRSRVAASLGDRSFLMRRMASFARGFARGLTARESGRGAGSSGNGRG